MIMFNPDDLASRILYREKQRRQAIEAILVALDVAENEGAISEIDTILAQTWVSDRLDK